MLEILKNIEYVMVISYFISRYLRETADRERSIL